MLEQRYAECFPDSVARNQSSGQQVMTHNQSVNFGLGSSSKKTAVSSNHSKNSLHIDIDTPNKSHFEFGTIVIKSNDKLSSQKTLASNSRPNRNPSQVAQLRLTTNPPDSVKRFTIKKSIISALDSTTPSNGGCLGSANSSTIINPPQQPTSICLNPSRNKSSLGFGLRTAVNAAK